MVTPGEIRTLFDQIRGARAPRERLRLASRAWKTVHALTPKERRQLAGELGIQGAEDLLLRLGTKQGQIPPEELEAILDRAGETDPRKLGQLLRDLRDPDRRRELLGQGIAAVTRALAGPPPFEAEAEAEPALETEAGLPPEPEESSPEPPQTPTPPAPATLEPEPPSVPEATAPPEERPEEPEALPPPAPAQTEPAPSPPLRPPALTPEPSGPPQPRQAPVSPSPLLSSPETGSAPTGGSELLGRLLELHRHLGSGDLPDDDDLPSLLGDFPPGWARRRALAALLSTGRPERLEEAMALVRSLPTAADRLWCWTALAAGRELTGDDVGSLLAGEPSAGVRRRLALRLKREG